MSSRLVTYGKKLGFILAGVLLATAPVISSVAWGAVVATQGFANPGRPLGFSPNGQGLNRGFGPRMTNPPAPTFNLPAFNNPALVSPAVPASVGPVVPASVSPAGPPIVAPSPSPIR
jgi:hypothetical protein